jgi:hypothetical protein
VAAADVDSKDIHFGSESSTRVPAGASPAVRVRTHAIRQTACRFGYIEVLAIDAVVTARR